MRARKRATTDEIQEDLAVAEIVNLRRARKARDRKTKEADAAANRIKSGTPKSLRALERSRWDKQERELEAKRLEDPED